MRTRMLFLCIVCSCLAGCIDPIPPFQDLKDSDLAAHDDIGIQHDTSSTTPDTDQQVDDHDAPNILPDSDTFLDADAFPDSGQLPDPTSASLAVITAGGGITTSTNYQLLISVGVPSQPDGYRSENYQLQTGAIPQHTNP